MQSARWFPVPKSWSDLNDPANPFAAPKRRRAFLVMSYLTAHADYMTGRASVRGELTTTLGDLADWALCSRSGAARIVEWLQEIGMIKLLEKKPQLRISVVNYDKFGKKAEKPKKTSNPALALHANEKSGTAPAPAVTADTVTISSICNHLENDLEKNWNTQKKSGTANGTPEVPRRLVATMQDDEEKRTEKNPEKSAAEKKWNKNEPFIKDSLTENHKKEEECGDRQAGPRVSSREPTAFEKEIAEDWNVFVKARGHKRIPIKSQYEGIRKLTQLDGYTEAEMREVLTWIKQHDFWPGAVLSLLALRERKNGVAKIETIIEQMRRDKSRAAKRQTEEEAKKSVQKPKKSIYDLYGRL
jgi:hypothetical protein